MKRSPFRGFLAVATAGGFSAAARVLGVTQPALTQQVKALEAHYGITLFARRGRKVTLTQTGEALVPIVRRILASEEEADTLLAEEGGLQRGTLRIAADGPYHIVPILSRLRTAYPGLSLAVTVGNSEAVERALLELRVDVAVLAQVSDNPELYARRYARYPVVVFVAKEHRWARQGEVHLEELHGEPMVIRERGSATRRVFEEAATRRGVVPRVVLEIESREAVREAVAAGIGFGVVSAPEIGFDERLALVPIADVAIHTEEYLVCLDNRRSARAIRAFLAAAKAPRL